MFRVIALILLSVVCSFVVASFLTWLSGRNGRWQAIAPGSGEPARVTQRLGIPVFESHSTWFELRSIGVNAFEVLVVEEGRASRKLLFIEAGWPMLCFSGAATRRSTSDSLVFISAFRWDSRKYDATGRGFESFWIQPLCPHWMGLFINGVVYLLSFAAVMRTWRFMREAVRAFRGRCRTCGYDRRGRTIHSPCPECGTPSDSQHAKA